MWFGLEIGNFAKRRNSSFYTFVVVIALPTLALQNIGDQ